MWTGTDRAGVCFFSAAGSNVAKFLAFIAPCDLRYINAGLEA